MIEPTKPSKCRQCPAAALYGSWKKSIQPQTWLCFHSAYFLGKALKAPPCATVVDQCPKEAHNKAQEAKLMASVLEMESRGIKSRPQEPRGSADDKAANLVGLYAMTCQEITYAYIDGAWDWMQEHEKPLVGKIAIAKRAIDAAWMGRSSSGVTIAKFLAAVNFWKQLVMRGIELYGQKMGNQDGSQTGTDGAPQAGEEA